MMLEAALGLLAVGPLSVWAVAVCWSKRRTSQPALAVYLGVTALTWVALTAGGAAGWFVSETIYTSVYVAGEIITWGLLAAVFVELASRRLAHHPEFRGFGERLVRWLWIACAAAVFGFVLAPESVVESTQQFHAVQRSLIQATLAASWVVFYSVGKYFTLQPVGRPAAEGWLLAALYFGFALFQPRQTLSTLVTISVLSAVCYGAGAVLHFRMAPSPIEPLPPKRSSDPYSAESAVRQARARLNAIDGQFDSIGRG